MKKEETYLFVAAAAAVRPSICPYRVGDTPRAPCVSEGVRPSYLPFFQCPVFGDNHHEESKF